MNSLLPSLPASLAPLALAAGLCLGIPSERVSQDEPPAREAEEDAKDIADVPWSLEHVGDEERMSYFLVGADAEREAPKKGWRLLVVLPGGDGSAEFRDFSRRIWKNALHDPARPDEASQYLLVQLIAPKWREDQDIIWPSKALPTPDMRFTTEEFVDAVVAEVLEEHEIDREHVFALGWSSSGTSVYAAALAKKTRFTGALIAMSVWKPTLLPELDHAKKRAFAILHSPEDFIPIAQAEAARDALAEAKAEVHYTTYDGGHGWPNDVYQRLRTNIDWLEEHHSKPVKR